MTTPEILLCVASGAFLVQTAWLTLSRTTRVAPGAAFLNFAALTLATVGLLGQNLDWAGGLAAIQAALWLWLALYGDQRHTEHYHDICNRLERANQRVARLIHQNTQLTRKVFEAELREKAVGGFEGGLDPSLFIPGTNQLQREVGQ